MPPAATLAEIDHKNQLDPRVRRSRQMLHDALATLLRDRPFDTISIQDIADASTLNRATFYSHYPDKHSLLQCMVASRFQELMDRRNVQLGSCEGALKALALGTCDFLAEMPGATRDGKQQVEESIQTAIVGVVQAITLQGMRHRTLNGTVSPELLASTVAWAVFGAASTWAQTPANVTADQMAETIDRLVSPILHAVTVPTPH